MFARKGLTHKRRRRRPTLHPGSVPIRTERPNDLWTADFKGHFRTSDGVYCYPLTIADQHTRFLLTCQGLLSTRTVGARKVFERAFREYGLPAAIRTDHGVPFATTALHGLSELNVWWLRLGIQHQRIRPASPQENGAHERPHKALGGKTPGSQYRASRRSFPERLPPLEYSGHFIVKRVNSAGTIRFKHKLLFLAHPLMQLHVGMEEIDDGIWSLYFGTVLLGRIDEREMRIYG